MTPGHELPLAHPPCTPNQAAAVARFLLEALTPKKASRDDRKSVAARLAAIDLRQEGEKVVGATRAPEEREADAAAAVLQETETPGGEDDDGSPPSGEET